MYCIQHEWASIPVAEDSPAHQTIDALFYVVGIEHVLAYICRIFRKWDLENHGKPDANGVLRAPWESILMAIE